MQVYVIAELGTAHGGSVRKARALVDAAAASAADCVKLQLVYADEILHPNTGEVPLPGGRIRLYDRFRQLEAPLSFFSDLKAYAESKGLDFLCSPFGVRSARELRSIGVSALKIASPELNHVELLDEAASYGLPAYLSAGVSRLADIEEALDRFGRDRATLLHCVTAYPAPPEDYNLRLIRTLGAVFGVPVGVSDHSLDPVLVPALAALQGAVAVEKHLCLSRDDDGLDDPVALPPDQFAAMVEALRSVEADPAAAEAGLEKRYGRKRLDAVLGDGVKRLAPSEAANYERTNRSVHALRELKAGTVLRAEDMAALRTEKVLRPGAHPRSMKDFVGRVLRADIPNGEGIRSVDV